jgi:DNA-binding beta-propeller fold protein YncE
VPALFLACSSGLCWDTSSVTALGTGSSGSSSDRLNSPRQLVIDSTGAFYVVDCNNHRIQKFTNSSLIGTTVAGQPNANWGATTFHLNQPMYALIDSSGNLYVSDSQNHRVQYFPSGSMAGVTIAGNGKLSSASFLYFSERKS